MIGGVYVGIVGLFGFMIVGFGLVSLLMFVDKSNLVNLIYVLIGFGILFVVLFVIGLIIWKNDEEISFVSDIGEVMIIVVVEDLMVLVVGKILLLVDVFDDVFL